MVNVCSRRYVSACVSTDYKNEPKNLGYKCRHLSWRHLVLESVQEQSDAQATLLSSRLHTCKQAELSEMMFYPIFIASNNNLKPN